LSRSCKLLELDLVASVLFGEVVQLVLHEFFELRLVAVLEDDVGSASGLVAETVLRLCLFCSLSLLLFGEATDSSSSNAVRA
jgi:hypothetical protein